MVPKANKMEIPVSVFIASGKLVVVDQGYHRVLIYNSIPTTNNQAADLVLGQASFTVTASSAGASGMYSPTGVWSNGTKVVVADGSNNRVLVWNTFPTSNGQAADVVIGQAADHVLGTADFQAGTAGNCTQSTLYNPAAVACDASGRIWVADRYNNRVLRYTE